MNIGYVEHNEAVIRHFVKDPEFATLYLQTVLADGDEEEITEVQEWYDEAQARRNKTAPKISRWSNVAAVL